MLSPGGLHPREFILFRGVHPSSEDKLHPPGGPRCGVQCDGGSGLPLSGCSCHCPSVGSVLCGALPSGVTALSSVPPPLPTVPPGTLPPTGHRDLTRGLSGGHRDKQTPGEGRAGPGDAGRPPGAAHGLLGPAASAKGNRGVMGSPPLHPGPPCGAGPGRAVWRGTYSGPVGTRARGEEGQGEWDGDGWRSVRCGDKRRCTRVLCVCVTVRARGQVRVNV